MARKCYRLREALDSSLELLNPDFPRFKGRASLQARVCCASWWCRGFCPCDGLNPRKMREPLLDAALKRRSTGVVRNLD